MKGEKSMHKNLDRWAHKMDRLGEKIEEVIKESDIDELGDTIGSCFGSCVIDKEQMKKKISGLIRIQKALPIRKLAEAMNIIDADAENLIYELVADGINGFLEEGVFKFTNTPEEIIKKLNEFIDRMFKRSGI